VISGISDRLGILLRDEKAIPGVALCTSRGLTRGGSYLQSSVCLLSRSTFCRG
jgi:hypothetical protein